MIVNYFKFVDHLNVTRKACVVDGQPFYFSSGTSSGLNGAWLPFNKFGEDIGGVTGRIHKPDVAYMYEKNILEYFPPGVANALSQWRDENPTHNNWGRFGNMKCLLISCMLSNEATVPAAIRKAVIDYVGENNYKKNCYLWARPTIFDCGYMLKTRTVNDDTLTECNNKLLQLGAKVPQHDAKPYPAVLEPAGSLQQFINSIPSLITRAMRFFTCYMRGEQAASELDPDNLLQNDLENRRKR